MPGPWHANQHGSNSLLPVNRPRHFNAAAVNDSHRQSAVHSNDHSLSSNYSRALPVQQHQQPISEQQQGQHISREPRASRRLFGAPSDSGSDSDSRLIAKHTHPSTHLQQEQQQPPHHLPPAQHQGSLMQPGLSHRTSAEGFAVPPPPGSKRGVFAQPPSRAATGFRPASYHH